MVIEGLPLEPFLPPMQSLSPPRFINPATIRPRSYIGKALSSTPEIKLQDLVAQRASVE